MYTAQREQEQDLVVISAVVHALLSELGVGNSNSARENFSNDAPYRSNIPTTRRDNRRSSAWRMAGRYEAMGLRDVMFR